MAGAPKYAPLGDELLDTAGDMGRVSAGYEKLGDCARSALSDRCSSWTLPKLVTLGAAFVCIAFGFLSKLTPRPVLLFGGGDMMRMGGSRLAVLRCDCCGVDVCFLYVFGRAGTGGGSSANPLDKGRPFGEGSRNVLSVIDPLLPCLCRLGRRPVGVALPFEENEFCRAMVLFVWTSCTRVGGGVWLRKAAAAAELDREAFEARLARKAWAAAVVAEKDGLTLALCNEASISKSGECEGRALALQRKWLMLMRRDTYRVRLSASAMKHVRDGRAIRVRSATRARMCTG